MVHVQDTNPDEAQYWLELANGGGVVLRDPSISAPSVPQYKSRRQPKQLEAAAAMQRAKDF